MSSSELEHAAGNLITEWLGHSYYYWPTVGSTMEAARELAEGGAVEGTIVIADEQTAGRGRLDRTWWAVRGTSLLFTLILRPSLVPRRAQRLTMICSLAVCDAIEAATGLAVQIKWPNDVLLREHKVCGILTELGLSGQELAYALVGVGINVNVDFATAPPLMVPATSLMAEAGRPLSRVDLLNRVLASLERRYEALQAGRSFHDEWAGRLATIGRDVGASAGKERWEGTALGVDQDGALLIRLHDGTVQRVLAADVTLRDEHARSSSLPAGQEQR
jgi:BirA family biotin operon repressor/biotin-[acetyl-CoA-carboxylase] ligase